MPAIITTAMRVAAAQNFLNYCQTTLQTSNSNLYTFISRTLPWVSDQSPPTPIDCKNELTETLSEMIAIKKVGASNVAVVAPRYNWTSGTVYTQYDDTINLFDTTIPPFYIVTSSLDVYKCISNAGNSPSTVSPIGTGNNLISTGDAGGSYIWKYMFSISGGEAVSFVTSDYIPIVTNATVAANAVPGTVDQIIVTQSGSQYTSAPTVIITGDGTGATAVASITSNAVTSIVMTNRGSGYSYANISFSGGGSTGSGAMARAIISPRLGHGADAVSELGAFTTMISMSLNNSENGAFTVSNDYRRIGLVQNVLLNDNLTFASSLDYDCALILTVTDVIGNYAADELITGNISQATGYVLDYTTSTGILRLVQSSGTFMPGELIKGSTSNAYGVLQTYSATLTTATTAGSNQIQLPSTASSTDGTYVGQVLAITGGTGSGQSATITAYAGINKTATLSTAFTNATDTTSTFVIASIVVSPISLTAGSILYLENRTPIIRASDQTEQIRFLFGD